MAARSDRHHWCASVREIQTNPLGCANRQPHPCATGDAGPKPRRARWAASNGAMAGGASWKGTDARGGRRIARGVQLARLQRQPSGVR